MMYLLKVMIFHGELLNDQTVSVSSESVMDRFSMDFSCPWDHQSLSSGTKAPKNTTISNFHTIAVINFYGIHKNGYHLVMTFTVRELENQHHAIKNGKPSNFLWAISHGYVGHNQRVSFFKGKMDYLSTAISCEHRPNWTIPSGSSWQFFSPWDPN